MNRRDKTNYYLDMAQVALERSTCLRRGRAPSASWGAIRICTKLQSAPGSWHIRRGCRSGTVSANRHCRMHRYT